MHESGLLTQDLYVAAYSFVLRKKYLFETKIVLVSLRNLRGKTQKVAMLIQVLMSANKISETRSRQIFGYALHGKV